MRRERPVHLGDEPALSVDRRLGPDGQRGGVSSRWLAGTVLTGFASTALMGGALYASLDRQTRFATTAELVASADGGKGPITVAEKGDRLARVQAAAHKQIVKLDTTTQVGNREFVKVRDFARITTGLALTRGTISPNPPTFDPQKIYAAAARTAAENEAAAKEAAAAPVEGEVSLVLTALDPSKNEDLAAVAELPPEEVARAVREAAEIGGQVHTTAMMPMTQAGMFGSGFVTGSALAFGPRDLDAYAALAIQGYAENVLNVSKSIEKAAPEKKEMVLGPDDKVVVFKDGDSLQKILTANGSSEEEAKAIVAVMEERFSSEELKPGLKIRMGISGGEDDRTRLRPVRVSIYDENEHRATVALSDTGQGYVAIDDPADLIADAPEPEEDDAPESNLSLYASLFETAQKNQIPRDVFETLVKTYFYTTDLQKKVEAGDNLEIFYSLDEPHRGEVFYAALTVDGTTKRFYRFQSPADGSIGFYDARGQSARKFLINKPITGGRRSSGFGMRRHPILGYAKMHTGLDYAARSGTPIMAAGNGVVEKAEWEGGYGRYVRIQHANGYETAYAHMRKFASGIKAGVKVKQGQIIGYVGSTGRSTGNHLHFEVLVNGRFVNPARLKAPRSEELKGNELLAFVHERQRIDWAMKRAPGETQQVASTPGG